MPAPQLDLKTVIEKRGMFQRAIERYAPEWGQRRLEAIVQRHVFSYQAAYASRIFSPVRIERPEQSIQSAFERHTLMTEARDLVKNSPIVARIPHKFALHCTPREWSANTGDRAYDTLVNDYFHDWCRQCDVTGRHSFRQLIGLAIQMHLVDGDCGIVERSTPDGLRIQLYAADLIGNPTQTTAGDKGYYDGVFLNPATGGPSAYRVFMRSREGSYGESEDIPVQYFHHYFNPWRDDQWRGVSRFHAVLQTARMLNDILLAEQVGVKFASQQGALVFNERGAARARDAFTPTGLGSMTLANGEMQKDELSDIGLIRYLQTGDKVQVMPGRPSSAFAGFVDHLMDEIAIGIGAPAAVLFGSSGYKGPNIRAEHAAGDRLWETERAIVADKVCDPVRRSVIRHGIATGDLPYPKSRDGESPVAALRRAFRGEWRWPASATIDVGRDSAAALNEHRQCITSGQKIAAEAGYDWFQAAEERIAEAKFLQDRCREEGLPESAVQLLTPALPSTPAAAASVGTEVGKNAADAQAQSVAPASDPAPADFSLEQRLGGSATRRQHLQTLVDEQATLRRLMSPGKN